jgi:uncharacterized protein YkwD
MFSRVRMQGWIVTVVALILLGGIFSFNLVAAENVSNETQYLPLVLKPEIPTPIPDFEERVVLLTNQQRLAHGCGLVTMDFRLRAAAEGHSQDMAINDFFSHTGSDGSSAGDRIEAQGYNWSRWGENIAAGYSSPESVVAGWMASSGHRANILNCTFIHIGVGYYYLQNDTGDVNYRHYWTQVFASP